MRIALIKEAFRSPCLFGRAVQIHSSGNLSQIWPILEEVARKKVIGERKSEDVTLAAFSQANLWDSANIDSKVL